jgi:hypothetical protein
MIDDIEYHMMMVDGGRWTVVVVDDGCGQCRLAFIATFQPFFYPPRGGNHGHHCPIFEFLFNISNCKLF